MPTQPVLRHELNRSWTFRETTSGTPRPAQVPGCVHTDLMRNGLIPDPFCGTNEQALQWIGEKDWTYESTFDVSQEILGRQNLELVFTGLDTYASVRLNGSPVLEADNMFREWRVDCKALLKPDGNSLSIRFRNVFDVSLPRYRSAPFPLQAFGTNDQADVKLALYSRKAQFHYGWDWGPRLITCGIWRPIRIEAWTGIRIKSVFIQQTKVTAARADLLSTIEVLSDTAQTAGVSVTLDSIRLVSEEHPLRKGWNRINVSGHIDKPALWWTNGLGSQPLYRYSARVTAGSSVDEYSTPIGIRSLEIVRDKDASGTSLYVRLNGVPVFMKGANYVPQDNFQNRVTRERYEHIIGSAAAAHMNMLRLWGGGIYEDDLFYAACDRHGILVWHDLQFACAMYPADEAFLRNVREEVIDNVTRIRNHPCLALYCGNNENEICWHQAWKHLYPADIQQRYEGDQQTLYHQTLPQALKEADPTRYYHTSSPNAGFNQIPYGEGDIHYWGVWHGKEPFETYPAHIARFVSEYGFQSYPELATVKRFAAPEDLDLNSPAMLAHQRCMADERKDKEYGNRLIRLYLDRWYRTPRDFKSYLYVSQIMQAEGVRLGMEAHRRAMPRCMGSLYWQIDDCWPVASWSSIDYFGRWKALHYAARAAFSPVIVSPVHTESDVRFHVVSDRLEPLAATLEIRVADFDGNDVSRHDARISIAPNSSRELLALPKAQLTCGRDEARLVLISRLKQNDALLFESLSYFRLPKDLHLSPPAITANVTPAPEGCSIELSTQSLAKNIMLSCGDDDGFFSDNYFDLPAGARHVVHYKTALDDTAVRQQLVTFSLVDSYS
jgi:beta-mannosidase